MLDLNLEEVRRHPLPAERPVPAAAESAGLTQAALLMRMLEEIDYGMLLVDGAGRFRYGNHLGLHELACGPLQLARGRVQARSATGQAPLSAALNDARRGLRRLFTARHDGSSVSISVVPIGGGADAPGEPLALLIFGKDAANECLSVDFYARSHGLTGAELTVLKKMGRGVKPKDIARELGVAISTVRSHICNIRLKTQTGSIRELLDRMAALPPITPAVKSGGLTMHEEVMLGLAT